MALVVKSVYKFFDWLFNEFQDPRVESYPLIGSPFPIIGLLVAYVYFVKVWGPNWMKDRKPYNLTTLINVYNFIQIFSNLIIGGAAFYYSYWSGEFSLACQPLDTTIRTPHMNKVVFLTYCYYLTKLVDLLDTVFFVLRKKNNQITFLHVYHHAGMVVATYIYSKFLSGSHGTLLGIINSFVHVVMYGYYFLTSYKPELKQSIWWKKHITQIQLIQFGILVVHFINPLLFFDCEFPMAIAFVGLMQNVFMLILFSDFYYRAYVKAKTTKTIT